MSSSGQCSRGKAIGIHGGLGNKIATRVIVSEEVRSLGLFLAYS
ncbi:hypothetical protein RintRC_5542 [Richelia intracellularis]|nr:hypothetical protein RintRC_5542 [Richelia intracellularis]